MTILRLVIFQTIWYFFINAGESDYSIYFPFLAITLTAIDKYIFSKMLSWKLFFNFSLFLLVCGIIIDSFLMSFNFIHFRGWESSYSPFYMWAIWLIFIPYYSIAFKKFHNKIFVTAICGFLFAPLSYYSGSNIGSLSVPSLGSLFIIGLMWALFLPTSIQYYFKARSQ